MRFRSRRTPCKGGFRHSSLSGRHVIGRRSWDQPGRRSSSAGGGEETTVPGIASFPRGRSPLYRSSRTPDKRSETLSVMKVSIISFPIVEGLRCRNLAISRLVNPCETLHRISISRSESWRSAYKFLRGTRASRSRGSREEGRCPFDFASVSSESHRGCQKAVSRTNLRLAALCSTSTMASESTGPTKTTQTIAVGLE